VDEADTVADERRSSPDLVPRAIRAAANADVEPPTAVVVLLLRREEE
jgi:hypothetical protein